MLSPLKLSVVVSGYDLVSVVIFFVVMPKVRAQCYGSDFDKVSMRMHIGWFM